MLKQKFGRPLPLCKAILFLIKQHLVCATSLFHKGPPPFGCGKLSNVPGVLRNGPGVLRNVPDVLHNVPGVLRNGPGVLLKIEHDLQTTWLNHGFAVEETVSPILTGRTRRKQTYTNLKKAPPTGGA